MSALLAVEGLTVQFGGLRALNGFSMQVQAGTIHALIGPNGAGKSTVFNCISRFYNPTEGSIRFAGRDILELPQHAIAGIGIARTFQNIELCRRLTVLENVLIGMSCRTADYFPFGPSSARVRAEKEALRQADHLLERIGLLPYRDTAAGHLDFGHQKMLDLARALAARPQLLLLDEPAAGLRNREIGDLNLFLKRLAREEGITIVLVEHVMQLVMAIADTISVLNFGGKIAEGPPAEIRGNPQVIEAYLGKGLHA